MTKVANLKLVIFQGGVVVCKPIILLKNGLRPSGSLSSERPFCVVTKCVSEYHG